jgi:hypothetical protein
MMGALDASPLEGKACKGKTCPIPLTISQLTDVAWDRKPKLIPDDPTDMKWQHSGNVPSSASSLNFGGPTRNACPDVLMLAGYGSAQDPYEGRMSKGPFGTRPQRIPRPFPWKHP